jgi:hypothetical protein
MQMAQSAMALERYKAEFGEYPPDMFDDDALVRHVRKRWPRYAAPNAEGIRQAISAAYASAETVYTVDFTNANSHSSLGALALWLGGFPNSDGKLSGFYADPENPFIRVDNADDRAQHDGKVFIDWEIGQGKNVRTADFNVPVVGTEVRGEFVPIVYFRGRAGGGDVAYNHEVQHFDFTNPNCPGPDCPPGCTPNFPAPDCLRVGVAVPYVEGRGPSPNNIIRWKNPTTYQLIHPGLDGRFGVGTALRFINPGTGDAGIGLHDLDNLTNFSDYKELRSILP